MKYIHILVSFDILDELSSDFVQNIQPRFVGIESTVWMVDCVNMCQDYVNGINKAIMASSYKVTGNKV